MISNNNNKESNTMASLGTAELTIEPKLAEGFTFGPDPRQEALARAIESVRPFDPPPGSDFIVERAEAFLSFLTPEA